MAIGRSGYTSNSFIFAGICLVNILTNSRVGVETASKYHKKTRFLNSKNGFFYGEACCLVFLLWFFFGGSFVRFLTFLLSRRCCFFHCRLLLRRCLLLHYFRCSCFRLLSRFFGASLHR